MDTHVLIWFSQKRSMAPEAEEAIIDPGNDVWVSPASIWEAEIKIASGKLKVDGDLIEAAVQGGFDELAITGRHASAAGRLPPHHKDPFDRMLIAQALVEELRVVTRDPLFDAYDVPVLAA